MQRCREEERGGDQGVGTVPRTTSPPTPQEKVASKAPAAAVEKSSNDNGSVADLKAYVAAQVL